MNRFIALLVGLLPAVASLAQTEIILDNVAPAFATTGTWPTSTAVGGYIGPNYQTHEANGAPPSAVTVDNTDPGFSVTGTWPNSTSIPGYLGSNYQVHSANGEPPSAIVADNTSGSFTGTWPTSTSVSGYVGTNYQVHTAGTGANVFTWSLNLASAGSYQVYARWTQHPNRATNAKYTVNHGAGPTVVTVNQEQGGGTWQLLGTWSFNAGTNTVSLSDEANDYVVADAVMLVPPGAAPNTATWSLNVTSAGSYNVYARWTAHPNRATDAKYTVNHAGGATTVTANQEANSGTWNLLGTYSFNSGNATVSLTDQANGYVIADAVMLSPPGAQPSTATWTPNVAQAGTYAIYARWTQHPNRATNAIYTVTHGQGSASVAVNQQANGGTWNLLGSFQLTPGVAHRVALTDQANGYVIADAIRLVPISVQADLKMYFIHTDHLNTPRAVYDDQQNLRWKWDQAEPFGVTMPDENPASLGAFEMPLRFPGQYDDKETGKSYNYFRDYDPNIGRYVQSDPIGLSGGLNTFGYTGGSPLNGIDPDGLEVALVCRPVSVFGQFTHCFVHVTCPGEGVDVALSLFGRFPYIRTTGYKAKVTSPNYAGYIDNPYSASSDYSRHPIAPKVGNCGCAYEKSVISKFDAAPATQPYNAALNNSNTFAQDLVTSPRFGTAVPSSIPLNAPAIFPGTVGIIR